jgi:hypothetical protein
MLDENCKEGESAEPDKRERPPIKPPNTRTVRLIQGQQGLGMPVLLEAGVHNRKAATL